MKSTFNFNNFFKNTFIHESILLEKFKTKDKFNKNKK